RVVESLLCGGGEHQNYGDDVHVGLPSSPVVVLVVVDGPLDVKERREMLRTGDRRRTLHGRQVGYPAHTDLAVGPRLGGDPLYAVVPVFFLGDAVVVAPLRLVPAADVLEEDHEP